MLKFISRVIYALWILIVGFPCYGAEILGIGAPCMDIIFHVEDEFLDKVPGTKGGSLQIDWKTFSSILNEGKDNIVSLSTGGSCANTIKGLAKFGDSCHFFGKVGKDSLGQRFLENISSLNIKSLMIETSTPTAQVACLITPDKQRTLRCFPGAGNELTEEDLTPEIFEGINHVHVEGYALYNQRLVEEVMKMAKERGITISFDLASFEVVKKYRERILTLVTEFVDVLFANEDETAALVSLPAKEGCCLLKSLCPVAVILVGKEGCWIGSQQMLSHISPPYVEVVDTTGAGDLFASGFLYGYLRGLPLSLCGYFGNVLGSAVITVEGAEIPDSLWPNIITKPQEF